MNNGECQRRTFHLWVLGGIVLAAFLIRCEGIYWPKFHPDEYPIGGWLDRTSTHLYIADKVYANGFFVLARPVQWVYRGLNNIGGHLACTVGLQDRVDSLSFDGIMFARWFNVCLGALTCIFVYGFARRVSGSTAAGLFAAGLMAFAQYSVEHSHYGETDMAMVMMLTLALWLWAVDADRQRVRSFAAAALVSGFAYGTKFSLIALIPLILVAGLSRRGFRNKCLFPLLAILCFVAGFVLANPAAVMDGRWFFSELVHEKQRVFFEMSLNLGILHSDPWVRYQLHARQLLEGMQSLGWGWFVLAVGGLAGAMKAEFRRYWIAMVLFPFLYAIYWIYLAPWVRTQEFMAFLPVLAVLAVLPLIRAWRTRKKNIVILSFALAFAALLVDAGRGWSVAEVFGWEDTRLMAREWLSRHMPDRGPMAAETYAVEACPETLTKMITIRKIEQEGLPCIQAAGAEYLLRAASITGRGEKNPLTGFYYPHTEAVYRQFADASERLCAWGTLPPQGLATFVSPTVELYGLKRFDALWAIDIELPQPLFIDNLYQADVGRQTFFPVGRRLGSATGVLIDRHPRTIAIGGPEELNRSIYIILTTQERPAIVNLDGMGQAVTVDLAPWDVAIIPMKRRSFEIANECFEKVSARTRREQDIVYLPCFLRVAYSVEEVARICLDMGREDKFWKCFREADLNRVPDTVGRYVLAVRTGKWALADRFEISALETGQALYRLGDVDPSTIRVNGQSGYYYNEFAGVSLDTDVFDVTRRESTIGWEQIRETKALNVVTLLPPNERVTSGDESDYEGVLLLPVRLARGRYVWSGEMMVRQTYRNMPKPPVFDIVVDHSEQVCGHYETAAYSKWKAVDFAFTVDSEIQPALRVRAVSPAEIVFRNIHLRWSLGSMLEGMNSALQAALIEHQLHRGQGIEALQTLEALKTGSPHWNDLEIRQLEFQALAACGSTLSDEAREAARRLLITAPRHYGALTAVSGTDPSAAATVESLRSNLKKPVLWEPFIKLVGIGLDDKKRELRCVFEATRNDTPPLAVSLWIQRHGEWRKRRLESLGRNVRLSKGERMALTVTLDGRFGEPIVPERLGLGIETDVKWHPGAFRLAGESETVLSVADTQKR